ncbi:MAG: hypothetical protein Q6353_008205 [Candidatus Sigynarchaeum springense]
MAPRMVLAFVMCRLRVIDDAASNNNTRLTQIYLYPISNRRVLDD